MSSRNRPRQTWLRPGIVFAVCAALAVFVYPSFFPQTMIAQEGVRGRSESGDLECVSYCSTTRPGAVLMEVKIRLADRPLNEGDLRSRVRQQGLEATVYADGFERRLFANVLVVQPKVLFRTTPTAPQRRIPGLERLAITDVATRLDKSSLSLHLTQPLTGSGNEAEWVIALLEGLDPGMAYTYRVPGRQSVVTCQAVVCPVDKVPANRTRTRP